MSHEGSCHCGRIRFEAHGEIGTVTQCNCSICSKRGYLLWFLPLEQVDIRGSLDDLSFYTFNKRRIKHYFCPECGCAPFGMAKDKEGRDTVAVNVRCLEDVDPGALEIRPFDGRGL